MSASGKTRAFVVAIAALGFVQLAAFSFRWRSFESSQFLLYFSAAAVCSLFSLKRADNGVSLSLPFVLLSVVYLNLSEAVLIGCTSVLIQFLRSPKTRTMVYRTAIAVAVQAVVIATAKFVMESLLPQSLGGSSAGILVGAVSLFVANTLPGAVALRLNGSVRLGTVWRQTYFWSFPYYLVSGVLVVVAQRATQAASLEDSLLVLTTVLLAYRYYRNQLKDTTREHASQLAALNVRAFEGLALAVEAKDNPNNQGHLRRVQAYSLAIGRELALSEIELQALQAGALLHDIGKLAIPDHILTKPGKLTPEEFAKMKVHPLVGAEIVDQVQFPHPVAPLVREHHEKWDGSGYPLGLKEEQITLGARILAVVDCLDALTLGSGIPQSDAI